MFLPAHSITVSFLVRIIQSKTPDFELTLNSSALVVDLTHVLLKRLHLTPSAVDNAKMELVYHIVDDKGGRFGTSPMFSSESLLSLLAKSPLKDNESPVLAVSIFSHDADIFKHKHPVSLAWKPPPTFSYDTLPAELNVRLIHGGTGYELQQKMLTISRGGTVKQLIRRHCFHACSSDSVVQDPSLPGYV